MNITTLQHLRPKLKSLFCMPLMLTMFGVVMLSACESKSDTAATIYIVRHAEKLTGPDIGRNPELSEKGKARAQSLVQILGDKGITHIHSTDYIRTTKTAAPLAEKLGLDITIYKGRDLSALTQRIKVQGGIHFVIGHSNTTEQTAQALGAGTDLAPIAEKTEYDRLYEVTLRNDGTASAIVTRYGEKYVPSTKQSK